MNFTWAQAGCGYVTAITFLSIATGSGTTICLWNTKCDKSGASHGVDDLKSQSNAHARYGIIMIMSSRYSK